MTSSDTGRAPTPMDIAAAYIKGAPPGSEQFGFLIGDWDAETTRYAKDGSVAVRYPGAWHAEYLHEKRMVRDEFTAYMPDGETEVGFFVTLRTYCEATEQWEMTFLTALQPQLVTSFTGRWEDGEMRLRAEGTRPNGEPAMARIRFHDITDAQFEWEQMTSTDGGWTWWREASIMAKRRT